MCSLLTTLLSPKLANCVCFKKAASAEKRIKTSGINDTGIHLDSIIPSSKLLIPAFRLSQNIEVLRLLEEKVALWRSSEIVAVWKLLHIVQPHIVISVSCRANLLKTINFEIQN